MSGNTLRKYIRQLEERALLFTEQTEITTRDGQRRNGNLLYTLRPIPEIVSEYYSRQMEQLEITAARQKAAEAQTGM